MEHNPTTGDRALSRYRKRVPALYLFALAAMALMILLNLVLREQRPVGYGLEGFSPINDQWFTLEGESFVIAEIDDLRTDDSDTVTIFRQLPPLLTGDQTLVFRSKNSAVSVLVDGQERYATDVDEGPFYNHSPGTRWNLVTLSPEDAGKTVELRVHQAYHDGRAKVDNFYFGDRAAILVHLIDAKLLGAVVSLLIFFVAIVFFSAWIVLNLGRPVKDHSLLWLAVFAAAAACWSLLETNLFQLFVPNLRILQVADNMMLVVAGLPLYLYLDSVYQVFRFRLVRVLCALDLAYILLATLSQFAGGWDYHQTLNGAVGTYAVVVAIFFVCLFRQRKAVYSIADAHVRRVYLMQQLGILMLGGGLLSDLVRYLTSDVLDRAFSIRIGLLCFILCFGAGNIIHMTELVSKGMEAEIVSQLAYLDGLTRLGNRTAYTERLQTLASDHADESMALAMFDINNLKWVNDTLGHKAGDALILCCANLLREAFPPDWGIFRIGGDEFVVLRHGGAVREDYDHAMAVFEAAQARFNETDEFTYAVAIAHGAAFAQHIGQQPIELLERQADRQMYENKRLIKLGQTVC